MAERGTMGDLRRSMMYCMDGDHDYQEEKVAVCTECGGKYRPAGGPCIHEHPSQYQRTLEGFMCGVCGVDWQPGHTCLRQPTAKEVQDMREQAYWLRVMEDVLDHFGYATQVAAPAAWEAV